MNDTLLIIGAGPSECTVNYPAIPNTWDTFGMNLMYQFYPMLHWQPTYFGCFDRRVCKSQADEFDQLMKAENCLIKRFFMVSKTSDSPRLTVLPLDGKTGDLSMDFDTFGYGGCTGVNCAQVGAILGHKRIILVGIDGYPTEAEPGAELAGRWGLTRTRASASLETYGRIGYQPDKLEYNLPQSEKYHRPAWEAFKVFAKQYGIEVVNCSWGDVASCFPRSTLSREIAKEDGSQLVSYCMVLKARSAQALESIRSVVNPENARYINFVVTEDESDDMLDLSDFPYRDLITHHIVKTGDTWNRSKLLNYAMKRVQTKLVAGWDADFMFSPEMISDYLEYLRKIDFNAYYLSIVCTETADSVRVNKKKGHRKLTEYLSTKGRLWGGFSTYANKYIQAVNGFDERFICWGQEDVDLNHRVERQFDLRKIKVRRQGFLLHVSHVDSLRNKDDSYGWNNRDRREDNDAKTRNIVNEQGWGKLAEVRHGLRVVLVGNGRSILRGDYGEFVDSCDRILRMNDFEIEGYEKHVGKRLDIYACGRQYRDRTPKALAQFTERWHPCVRGAEPRAVSTPEILKKYWPEHIRLHFIEQATFDRLVSEARAAEPEAEWGPSSGIRFINMVFDAFPRAQVYILGFDQFATGHYYCRQPAYLAKFQAGTTHREAIHWERKTINSYIEQGKIIRLDDV